MNTIKINSVPFNRVGLNVIGEIRSSAGGGGDVPSYPNGVYIQHIDGTLYTQDEWVAENLSKNNANGIAILADEARFVFPKSNIGKYRMNEGTAATENFPFPNLDYIPENDGVKDFNGASNTKKILESGITCPAAIAASEFVFPNGAKGYLPSMGEMYIVYLHKAEVKAIYPLIGGSSSGIYGAYWSSTQNTEEYMFRPDMSYGSISIDLRVYDYNILPMTAL